MQVSITISGRMRKEIDDSTSHTLAKDKKRKERILVAIRGKSSKIAEPTLSNIGNG